MVFNIFKIVYEVFIFSAFIYLTKTFILFAKTIQLSFNIFLKAIASINKINSIVITYHFNKFGKFCHNMVMSVQTFNDPQNHIWI